MSNASEQPIPGGLEGASDPIIVVTHGDVRSADVDYGLQRLRHVVDQIAAPVLVVRLKLTQAGDPSRARGAISQAMIDLNGEPIRAEAAGHDMRESIDLLVQRLADELAHRATRREARRHNTGVAAPGEWRHGDVRTQWPGASTTTTG